MKIICPAPSKMGTVSLCAALKQLGIAVAHYPHDEVVQHYSLRLGEPPTRTIDYSDGIADLPAAIWWRELMGIYPDSQIIVTYRNFDAWVKSMLTHYANNPPSPTGYSVHDALRIAFYGFCGVNADKWTEVANRHYVALARAAELDVFAHWHYIDLDGDNEQNWRELCDFLTRNTGIDYSEERETMTFPHLNKTVGEK